jgi:ATP-dependent Clp protease ATP-binding subunit ClpA
MTNYVISDDQLKHLTDLYCRDFTALAAQNRFDPITGRDDEIDQAILILLQKGRKNVALLAPAGVGKTALVVGLAQRIISGNVPDYLKNARVLEVDLASMAAGTMNNAEFQGRFIPLCRGFAERYRDPNVPKTILFLDEIHTIMPAVTGSAYAGLSEAMKPYLTVGDLHVIGATTLDEYRLFVEKDPALDRRFQKVLLKVPSAAETVHILKTIRKSYESHHKITIPDDVIETLVDLTETHLRRRNQPDKSIIMMDAACAWFVYHHGRDKILDIDSVKIMIAKETNVNAGAL